MKHADFVDTVNGFPFCPHGHGCNQGRDCDGACAGTLRKIVAAGESDPFSGLSEAYDEQRESNLSWTLLVCVLIGAAVWASVILAWVSAVG